MVPQGLEFNRNRHSRQIYKYVTSAVRIDGISDRRARSLR